MGEAEATLLSLVITGFCIWWFWSFYWGRIMFCAILLALYGSAAVLAPAYFAFQRFMEGNTWGGLLTILVGFFLALGFCLPAKAALFWVIYQHRTDGFFRRWNERSY
tara:strand:- start:10260 stop:10580 length:321 start_codon:yes stop_codon:yes gene_type:complete